VSGANTVNIKPITQKQAQKLWRCGIPLLWKYSFPNSQWHSVNYNHGSPLTQAGYEYCIMYGVEVE